MINNKVVAGIILMAGNSTRYGQNRNKNLDIVNGRHIVLYSLDVFNNSSYIDEIILTIKEDEREKVEEVIKQISFKKNIKLVAGGSTRQESVYNSLQNTASDIVLVHDGARPMVKEKYVEDLLITMKDFKGATIAVKSKDTIKISDDNGVVIQTTKRDNTWVIQTPQCFDREILWKAHNKEKDNPLITDDCMLLESINEKIKLVEGDYSNIKVTTYDDLNLVKEFMNINLLYEKGGF